MKQIRFTLSGNCLVPDDACAIDGVPNHVLLASGQVISIQPVIELASGIDADDHRDLAYNEAVSLDLYLECEDRTVALDEDSG